MPKDMIFFFFWGNVPYKIMSLEVLLINAVVLRFNTIWMFALSR